jgi:SAM-dependent methyltransferase
MVHALEEIRRVLVPKGVLIDLRPLETNWPVEIAWSDGFTEVARLTDLPEAVADDTAASRAMEEAEARGWFRREHEEFFPYFYSWDVPSEMQEFMETEWEGIEKLSEEGLRAAQSAWAVAEADARVRVRVSMMIARWRKL